MDFEEYVQDIVDKGYRLVCPYGCSALGFLCSGNPMTTPCGLATIVDNDGNEITSNI